MRKSQAKPLAVLRWVVGVGGVAAVVSAFTIIAGAGAATTQAKPVATSPPTISGTPVEGKTLVGTRGTWTNNPTSYSYRWLRCAPNGGNCAVIAQATSVQYTLTSADVGRTIRFRVDATNADGTGTAYSAPTAIVASARPVNTSAPTISGMPVAGKTLLGSRGTWTNNPTSYSYHWARCAANGGNCSLIAGATSVQYTLTSADVGHTIRFRVDATNAAGTGTAYSAPTAVVAATSRPVATSLPTISGEPKEGKTLTGTRGTWTNNPTSYSYRWARCAANGGSCALIAQATSVQYTLTSADVAHTIRFRVDATNAYGTATAYSAPTALISAGVPPRGPGCPSGSGNPDQVTQISPPARLLVDTLQSDPVVATRGTQTLTVRFHVTSTCGGPVQGALVYATATPFNQFSIPPETPTGADGWATLTFQRLQGFPVSRHQQLIALFVRARKAGENVLLGISTRRLASVRVNLRR
jgi:hypothetical protein